MKPLRKGSLSTYNKDISLERNRFLVYKNESDGVSKSFGEPACAFAAIIGKKWRFEEGL